MIFRDWLELQVGRDDPVGDLARDATAGGCAGGCRSATFEAYAEHVTADHRPSDGALEAVRRAGVEYRRAVRRARSAFPSRRGL